MIPTKASVLRIYVNAVDRFERKPLYLALVEKARSMGLAGASVFNVDESYGANRELRVASSEYSFVGIPVVIEMVDGREAIDRFLAEAHRMIGEGLCVVTPARVVRYVHAEKPSQNGG